MNEKNNLAERINIIALGNNAVGKTCFILKYTDNFYNDKYLATIGVDFKVKSIQLPHGKEYKIYFYDTAGQERFRSISLNIIKYADGIILMYDITNKETFNSISSWMKSIMEIKENNFPIVIIGNKCDLEHERIISKQEGEELAKSYNLNFYETSNKVGINVEESCQDLINQILKQKEENNDENYSIKLYKKNSNNEKKTNANVKNNF